MIDMQRKFIGLVESSFDPDLEYQRLRDRFQSDPGRDPIKLTREILGDFGIKGFFVFDLDCPARFLSCIGTLPETFIDGVKENGLVNADQVLRHLTAGGRPQPLFRSIVDSYVRSAPLAPKAFMRHKEFESYLNSFGIDEVYYHPFTRPNTNVTAAFCLYGTGSAERFRRAVEKLGPRIEPLAKAFCISKRINVLAKVIAKRRGLLTPAPAMMLRLMAEKDLSAGEIARYLDLHEVTVNKHVAAAKKAVGATTLPGLVAQCLKQGYFTIDDIC